MDRRPDLSAPRSLATSWLAAAVGAPLVMVVSAAGQGLGTVVAAGQWIGLSLPWDRQVWALVNQPTMNFAASVSATGYWLGPSLALLALAGSVGLTRKLQTLGGHLAVVQIGWVAIVLGLGWSTLLEGPGGQVGRWLAFRGLAPELCWLTPVIALPLAAPVVLRLLSIDRVLRFHQGRGRRIALVTTHLWPIPLVAIGLFVLIHERLPLGAGLGAALPMAASVAIAWFGYPAPPSQAIAPVRPATPVWLAVVLAALVAAVGVAGRPLPDGTRGAVQWSPDTATNNIRPWMNPSPLPWLDP